MFISERIEDRVNKIVAEKLGLPIALIDKLNTFQWKVVLEATSIYCDIEITNLARLKIKPKIVDSNIQINLNKISRSEKKLSLTDDPKTISRINNRIKEYNDNIVFLKSKQK